MSNQPMTKEKFRNWADETWKKCQDETWADDPALHFCHRFAILMECMLLSEDINLDKYWDEAHALLGEYHKAQEWWQHQMGEPYVSGFGKD